MENFLNQLLNIGTSTNLWLNMFLFAIVIIGIIWVAMGIVELIKSINQKNSVLTLKRIKNLVIRTIVVTILYFIIYFGSGNRDAEINAVNGHSLNKHAMYVPDSSILSDAEIDMDAYNNTDKELKVVKDSNSTYLQQAEKKNNKELEETLKRWDK